MKVLMHKNAMDVAFDIFSTHHYKPGYITYKGQWVNLGYTGKPWSCSGKVKIDVKVGDRLNWVDITDKIKTPRKMPGLPK
jgi:hypothetical protein